MREVKRIVGERGSKWMGWDGLVLLTKHVTMCLISVGHGDGLLLAKMGLGVSVIGRLDVQAVDVCDGTRVGKV